MAKKISPTKGNNGLKGTPKPTSKNQPKPGGKSKGMPKGKGC